MFSITLYLRILFMLFFAVMQGCEMPVHSDKRIIFGNAVLYNLSSG